MNKWKSVPHSLAVIVCCAICSMVWSHGSATAESPAKYMGTGSCSSSNCHGGVKPRKSGNVLQNEYVTWHKYDKHSKAWTVLTSQDSKRIAYHLGIADATRAPECLRCHATYVSDKQRHGESYEIEDGISCESCHGAAEHWLASHTARDATHTDNVKRGMTDLGNASQRAALCLDCHYGASDRAVTHRLIGAGHPRLSFELDTFSMIQPAHWEFDADYAKRKGEYRSADAWLWGQITQALRTVEHVLAAQRSDNLFPEFTDFYCYACHHSLTGDQWKRREYGGTPGDPRYNMSSLVMVVEALTVLSPPLAQKLQAELANLHQARQRDAAGETLKAISSMLNGSVRGRLLKKHISEQDVSRLLKHMTSFAAKADHPQYEDAEQAAMAISALLASMPSGQEPYMSQIESMYASLEDEERFKAGEFTAAARKLLSRL